MIRRTAREIVLQSLFQMDFTDAKPEEALEIALEVQNEDEGAKNPAAHRAEVAKALPYARTVLEGTEANLEAIDGLIAKYAINWDVKRMPGIDRNILRLAIYEMCFAEEKVPVNIAVNEAVELAKEFGSDASSRFVNGVLGKMMRDQQG
ncbi:MAG: transcription antitermination factor NusB [Succiniclasticum sp.]|jgi:N utilization substance protein B|nr:transcription antitermination factor NusB [Succiniclasticum sp.]MEE3479232.1 transcription antitermination factor NusB [Succiniclasticum sp.]